MSKKKDINEILGDEVELKRNKHTKRIILMIIALIIFITLILFAIFTLTRSSKPEPKVEQTTTEQVDPALAALAAKDANEAAKEEEKTAKDETSILKSEEGLEDSLSADEKKYNDIINEIKAKELKESRAKKGKEEPYSAPLKDDLNSVIKKDTKDTKPTSMKDMDAKAAKANKDAAAKEAAAKAALTPRAKKEAAILEDFKKINIKENSDSMVLLEAANSSQKPEKINNYNLSKAKPEAKSAPKPAPKPAPAPKSAPAKKEMPSIAPPSEPKKSLAPIKESNNADTKLARTTNMDKSKNGAIATRGFYLQVGVFSQQPNKIFLSKIGRYSYRIIKAQSNGKEVTKYLIGPFKNRFDAAHNVQMINIDMGKSLIFEVK